MFNLNEDEVKFLKELKTSAKNLADIHGADLRAWCWARFHNYEITIKIWESL